MSHKEGKAKGQNNMSDGKKPHLMLPRSDSAALLERIRAREQSRQEFEEQLQTLTDTLEEACMDIIFNEFPKRIKQLDAMYNTAPEFSWPPASVAAEIELPKGATRAQIKEHVVPCNELIDILKKELLDMSFMMSKLGIWVKLNIPRIEDGNNFGVEVQSEIMEVLDATESSGLAMLDGFTAYHVARAEMIRDVLKHSNILDYSKALRELEAKTYLKSTLVACDLRNNYLVLYNLITKNLEKIKSPRGAGQSAYQSMY